MKLLFLIPFIACCVNTPRVVDLPDTVKTTVNHVDTKRFNTRQNWYHLILIDKQYKHRALGGIYNGAVVVYNNTDYDIDNINVYVAYIKENGDLYKRENIFFNHIKSKSKSILNIPDSNHATSVEVGFEEIEAKQFNFCYVPGNWANKSKDPYNCQ